MRLRIVPASAPPPAQAPGACRAALQSGRGHGPQFVAAAPSRTGARRFNRARAHELICTCHRAQQSRWSPAPGRCVFVITVCVCLPSHDIRTHPPTPRRPSCPRARSIMFSDRGNGSKVSSRGANGSACCPGNLQTECLAHSPPPNQRLVSRCRLPGHRDCSGRA